VSSIETDVGAARAYTEQILGGPVSEEETTISVGASLTTLLGNRGDRVGAVLVNMGTGTVFMAPTNAVSSTRGVPLGQNGSISLILPYDFTLVARQWNAVSDAGGPYNVYVIEYFRVHK
jgi:hypothetical protein